VLTKSFLQVEERQPATRRNEKEAAKLELAAATRKAKDLELAAATRKAKDEKAAATRLRLSEIGFRTIKQHQTNPHTTPPDYTISSGTPSEEK